MFNPANLKNNYTSGIINNTNSDTGTGQFNPANLQNTVGNYNNAINTEDYVNNPSVYEQFNVLNLLKGGEGAKIMGNAQRKTQQEISVGLNEAKDNWYKYGQQLHAYDKEIKQAGNTRTFSKIILDTGLAGAKAVGDVGGAVLSPFIKPLITDENGNANAGGEALNSINNFMQENGKKVGDALGVKTDYSKSGIGDIGMGLITYGAGKTLGLGYKGVKIGVGKFTPYLSKVDDGVTPAVINEIDIDKTPTTDEYLTSKYGLDTEGLIKNEIDNLSPNNNILDGLQEYIKYGEGGNLILDTDNIANYLKAAGIEDVGDYVKNNGNDINLNNLYNADNTIVSNADKLKIINPENINNTIKDSADNLIENGYLEYKGLTEDGDNILGYTEDGIKKFNPPNPEVIISKDVGDLSSSAELTTSDKLLKIIGGSNKIEKEIKANIDDLLNNKDNYSASDLVANLEKLNDTYDIGIGDDIKNIYRTDSGEINIDAINNIQKKVEDYKLNNYYQKKDILAGEIKAFKLGIGEDNFINKVFKQGKKIGGKAEKVKYENLLSEEKTKYSNRIKEKNIAFQEKIKELKIKYKENKIKFNEKLKEERIKHSNEKNILKEKYQNKINSIKENINYSKGFKSGLYTFFNNLKNNKNYYGSKDIGKFINKRILSSLVNPEDAAIIGPKIMAKIMLSHKDGVISSIKRELNYFNKFTKNTDRTTRMKLDAKLYADNKAAFYLLKGKDISTLPLSVLEGINDRLIMLRTTARQNGILNANIRGAKIAGLIKDIKEDVGGSINLLGDVEKGTNMELVHRSFFNKVKEGIKGVFNGILTTRHAINIMGKGSTKFTQIMFTRPLVALSKYKRLLDNDVFPTIHKAISVLKKYEGSINDMGFYALANRRGVKGETLWVDKLIETAYKNGKLRNEYKLDNEIVGNELLKKPDILKDISDEDWLKISNTKIGQGILRIENNPELLDLYNNTIMPFFKRVGDDVADVALKIDGEIMPRNRNYVKGIRTGGDNDISVDLSLDSQFDNKGINDGVLKDVVVTHGGTYETNIIKMMLVGGREGYYYSSLRGVFKDIKDIYNGVSVDGKHIDGISTIAGEKASKEIRNYMDRLAVGQMPIGGAAERILLNLSNNMSVAMMTFKGSTTAVQFLSTGDTAGVLGIKNAVWSTKNIFTPGVMKRIYNSSQLVEDMVGGYDFINDINRHTGLESNAGYLYKKFLSTGTKGIEYANRLTGAHAWLTAYYKKIKELRPGISDDEILLLNNSEAKAYADTEMIGIMSSSEWIFSSPLLRTPVGKIIFNLSSTMTNRFGMYISKMYLDKQVTNSFTKAFLINSWFPIVNITELGLRYGLAKLYFSGGLSEYNPDQDYTDEDGQLSLAKIATKALNAQISSTPVLGFIENAMANPDMAKISFASQANTLYKGLTDIVKGANGGTTAKSGSDYTIDGYVKLLKAFGLGDIGSMGKLLK